MNIDQLALHKDYDSLSPAERAFVLAEMPREEYEHLHQLLFATQGLDKEAEAPSRLRENLLSSMKKTAVPVPPPRLLTRSIPLWQAAAALFLCFAATFWMRKERVTEKTITAWQIRVDTVYKENILWRDRVIVKKQIVYRDKETLQLEFAAKPENNVNALPDPDFQVNELPETHIGTSLGDTPELMGFFTQGDH